MKLSVCLASLLPLWSAAFAPVRPVQHELVRYSSAVGGGLATSSTSTSRDRVVLCMGWGPEPVWAPAQVEAAMPACSSGRSVLVQVQVTPETAAEYTIPGTAVGRCDEDAICCCEASPIGF